MNNKNIIVAIICLFGFNVTISAQWVQTGPDIDGEATGDYFGTTVSINGDGTVIAVGAENNDATGGVDAGEVSVYEWTGSSWLQIGQDIGGESTSDLSGGSVCISQNGNIVAIGSRGNDGNGVNAGHVRIFEWNGISWTQKGSSIEGESAGDLSGHSIDMSGDGSTVVIGAYANGVNNNGHARAYQWNGSNWTQMGTDLDGDSSGDRFSFVSMSADGLTIAIGAPFDEGLGAGTNSGVVKVFNWNGSAWVQKGIDMPGESSFDLSGHSISLSEDGNIIAIGAEKNDGSGGVDAGHVRVFEWTGSSWSQLGQDIDGESTSDLFGGSHDYGGYGGSSVGLSDDGMVVAIGAPGNDNNGTNSGQAKIYAWNGSSWSQKGQSVEGEGVSDLYGGSVNISADGSSFIVGSLGNDANGTNAGHVRVFSCQPSNSIMTDTTICSQYVSPGGQILTQTGTYQDTIINNFFCDSIITIDLTIESASIIQSGATLNANISGATYQWLDCDNGMSSISGETNQSFTLTNNGNYAVIVSDGTCSDTSACINVSDVGVEEKTAIQFQVYPNPTDGSFSIFLNQNLKNFSVTVYDILGEIVETQWYEEAEEVNSEINGKAGIYIIQILENNGKNTLFKLIKK